MISIHKYPRTRHVLDSRLQPGDMDLSVADFAEIAGRHLVIEEKVDGANAAMSFDADGTLRLQSRGHYLTGGPRERHFNLLKRWAHAIADVIRPVLRNQYVVYGEWVYAKHTIFYDALPHYFLEFDVLDLATGTFLSTPERRRLLADLPLCSVRVLREGRIENSTALKSLIGPTAYKSPDWRARLAKAAQVVPHRADLVDRQTDPSDLMEGLYIKVEETGRVVGRFKYIRADFLTSVLDSESHWQSRPILPNRLAPGISIDSIGE
jgi:hypothetical protein